MAPLNASHAFELATEFSFPVSPVGSGESPYEEGDFETCHSSYIPADLDYLAPFSVTDDRVHLAEDWNANGSNSNICGSGLDKGETVTAVANGIVWYVRNEGDYVEYPVNEDEAWGKIVVLRHYLPDGTEVNSLYAHLETVQEQSPGIPMAPGQFVGIGEPVGTIGDAEEFYDPHLHWEIHVDGRDIQGIEDIANPYQDLYEDPHEYEYNPIVFSYGEPSVFVQSDLQGPTDVRVMLPIDGEVRNPGPVSFSWEHSVNAGGARVADRYELWIDNELARHVLANEHVENYSAASVAVTIDGLGEGGHSWKVCASNAFGTQCSNTLDFFVGEHCPGLVRRGSCSETGPPVVETDPVSNETQASARLNMTVDPRGIDTEAWFSWGDDTSLDNETERETVGDSVGAEPYSKTISGLECETTYYFRAHAENAEGRAPDADRLEFRTDDCDAGGGGEEEVDLIDEENQGFEGGNGDGWLADPDFYIDGGVDAPKPRTGTNYAFIATPDWYPGNNLQGSFISFEFEVPDETIELELSFYVWVESDETTSSNVYDFLDVYMTDDDLSLDRITGVSNLDDSSDYFRVRTTLDETYAGERKYLWFYAETDFSNPTIFRLDDVSLVATVLSDPVTEPDVQTSAATDITESRAVLNLEVTPNGAPTTVWFEWDDDTSLDRETEPEDIGSGYEEELVGITVNDLDCDTRYYFRAIAENSEGDDRGSRLDFRTEPCTGAPPDADTDPAESITQTSAVLTAEIDPNGESTDAWFEWGLTSALGESTPRRSVGSGSGDEEFEEAISGLACGNLYYFQAHAENDFGEDAGSTHTFTTAACDPEPTAPVAENDSYTIDQGAVLTASAPGVLGNDSDPDGDPITAVLVSNVGDGALSLYSDGSFDYTPDFTFSGIDSFTYVANDGSEESNIAVVTITVITEIGHALPAIIDLGAAPGAEAVPVTRLYGPEATNTVGYEVTFGDINGDSYVDVVVGNEDSDSETDRGAVHVYFGGPESIGTGEVDLAVSQANVLTIRGAESDELGGCVAVADVNGDGLGDLILGADDWGIDGMPDAGQVYVLYGKSEWPEEIDLHAGYGDMTRVQGNGSRDYLGRSCSAGDVTGDGFADLILGAHSADLDGWSDVGKTFVVPGSSNLGSIIDLRSPPPGVLTVYGGSDNEDAGEALGAGDFNNDGYADVLIGADVADPAGRNAAGVVYIVWGSASLPSLLDMRTNPGGVTWVYGANAHDNLGDAIAVGDLDDDGQLDLILGGGGVEKRCVDNCGGVFILWGDGALDQHSIVDLGVSPGDEVVAVTRIYGTVEDGLFGAEPIGVGDVDQDGQPDLLIGASGSLTPAGETGTGHLLYDSPSLRSFDEVDLPELATQTEIWGDSDADRLGRSSMIGDINGDGYPDLGISASGLDLPDRQAAGGVYVIYGAPRSELNAAPIANADSYTVSTAEELVVAAPGVLENDSDPDGDAISAYEVTPAVHGSLVLAADGSFSYFPNAGFTGIDVFTYVASDGLLESGVATVEITVEAVNVPPVAFDDRYVSSWDVVLGGIVTENDYDPDDLDAELVVGEPRAIVSEQGGTVTWFDEPPFVGFFDYSPPFGMVGADSFTYFVLDEEGGVSNTATVTVELAPQFSASATCPGEVVVAVSAGTPNGEAAFLYGHPGSSVLPVGPCVGTEVALAFPRTLVRQTLDENGSGSASIQAPVGACGLSLQMVDVVTCTVSAPLVVAPAP